MKLSSSQLTLLIILLFTTATWSHCIESPYSDYNYGYYRYMCTCSNMSFEQYNTEINNVMDRAQVSQLSLRHVQLPVLDDHSFDNYNYRYLYNLTLQQCNISEIKLNSFQNFQSLTNLYIFGNNINYFNNEFMNHLHQLETLDITNNNINKFNIKCNFRYLILNKNPLSRVQKSYFEKCNNLHTLNMSNCQIKTIEDNVFNDFLYLNYLELQNNSLQDLNLFPTNNFQNLQILNMDNNNITTIDFSDFQRLCQINKVNLNNNNISTITLQNTSYYYNDTYQCKSLATLLLKNNKITHLPDFQKVRLINLRELSLSGNPISTIEPGAFNGLSSLIKLDFKVSLPVIKNQTFTGLVNVESLDLSSMNIMVIESNAFFDLQNLKMQNNNITFDLSYLELKSLNNDAFNGLLSLIKLNLSSNKIEIFPCNIFEQGNVIKELDISNNLIEGIHICAFQNLFHLEILHIQNNKLHNLKTGALSALSNLKYLDISYNKLSSLSELSMHPLENLAILNISANSLKTLATQNVFHHLKHLTHVDISGNLWQCSDLISILKYFRSRRISHAGKILNFDSENIGGIQCYENGVTTPDAPIEYAVKSTDTNKNIEGFLANIQNSNKIITNLLNNTLLYLVNGTVLKTEQKSSTNFEMTTDKTNINNILNNNLRQNNLQTEMSDKASSKQVLNNNLNELHNTDNISNSIKHFYNLFLVVIIIYICYKIATVAYQIYRKRNEALEKSQSTLTALELMNTL